MKTCDICGAKLGFRKFRCQDGVVCKSCYGIVSNHFTLTISKMTLAELKKNYVRNAQSLNMGEEGFLTTRKIGSFLLLDENNEKFCILSNWKVTGQHKRPEIFSYHDLQRFCLSCDPQFTAKQLMDLAADKSSTEVVQRLTIELYLKGNKRKEIVTIPSPVRTSSFAFRQSYKITQEILDCLADI